EQVYDVMSELVREHHCTTVIVSHDPESARIADRIIRIRDGRVSEEWSRDGGVDDAIVVGRGGWLRLPEEVVLRAGIGSHATARFEDGEVVVAAASGTRVERVSDTVPVSDAPGGPVVAETKGLSRRFGETVVLDGLDAAFRAGRLTAVVGPSGSGKTTFLHLLAGLDLPDAGSVTIDGVELTSLDRAARAALRRERVAYVGQQAGLVPHLSAVENVELALALRGRVAAARPVALGALESVGLA